MTKRNKPITFYLSEQELENIKSKAKDLGISMSDYIRMALRKVRIQWS